MDLLRESYAVFRCSSGVGDVVDRGPPVSVRHQLLLVHRLEVVPRGFGLNGVDCRHDLGNALRPPKFKILVGGVISGGKAKGLRCK